MRQASEHSRRRLVLAALGTVVVSGALPGLAAEAPTDAPPPSEEDQADERARERLRREHERQERERADTARRRDSELARQTEITRLQMRITTLEREESTLSSQTLSAEQQLLYARQDPADLSASSRRGELQSRLSFMRSQLQQKTAERQAAQRQLENARFR